MCVRFVRGRGERAHFRLARRLRVAADLGRAEVGENRRRHACRAPESTLQCLLRTRVHAPVSAPQQGAQQSAVHRLLCTRTSALRSPGSRHAGRARTVLAEECEEELRGEEDAGELDEAAHEAHGALRRRDVSS
jgi:hypothetical protein